jgi:hypothetical protein
MFHIFKYVLTDYIDICDKQTLLSGSDIQDFYLPFDLLGISVHYLDDFAMRMASYYGRLDVIKYLIEKEGNVNANNDECLRHASSNGYVDVVKYLVENGADIHIYNDEALISACANGHLDVIKYLIYVGVSVHA